MLRSALGLRRAVLLAVAVCILTLGCDNTLDLSLEHDRCSDSGQCLPGYFCNADNTCLPATVSVLPSLPGRSSDRVFVATFSQEADASICSPGLELCDGSCTNLSTSATDCGACGRRCPEPSNGVGICHAGACTIACEANYFACGGECVNLVSDPLHCGSCATRCDGPPNGNATCVAGKCEVSCAQGLMRCGDSCVDLSKDASNCGGCGKICVAPAAGTAMCSAGKCVTTCPTGLRACKDHCVDSATDVGNCGQCDRHCKMHQSCIGGVCFGGD